MTNPESIKYPYQTPEGGGNLDICKDNLFMTLIKNGQDFIDYGPIGLVEELFNKHGEDLDFRDYLNNFDFTLQQAIERKLAPIFGKIDPTRFKYGEYMPEKEKNRHSQKHLEQTIEDFWNDANQAIKTCGIDIEKLTKAYAEKPKQRESIYRQIRPIYIELRKQGYTSYDLTY